ncbi:hypothetical protein K3G39_15365 [Pontibacter sp. HSC-14F20]|uniref:hypothetical protein n=1 Tax=Pontibacter sp. HSC-14F20 TaxID=2864136 RepID=UPI001C73BE76|nr:hypothetical protein [Pontibacter sp. HSC-14F20]MBX0334619.1 hypothetical protein [Pontibacter sp. HSC-14F20]
MKQPLHFICLLALVISGFTMDRSKPIDYLNIPGPINFNDTNFNLVWSSNPNANYFKQEYIPAGEVVERYNQMILVEVVFGDLTVEDAVKAQVNVIQQRKKTDQVAQYQIIENPNTGEIILDFLMSAGTKKKLDVVEWNAYRYKAFEDEKGRKGILLFAISRRGYNENITPFLKGLKDERVGIINLLGAYEMPTVRVKQ